MTKPVAREKEPETSVIEVVAPEAPQAETQPSLEGLRADEPNPLEALVKALQARLDTLEGRTNESYADDAALFIAKQHGEQWSERRLDVASKSYVDVQMSATAFFGPFNTPEAVAAYLNAKKGRRPNDYLDWENVRTVTGREKRTIEANERTSRESQGIAPKIPKYFG